MLLLSFRLRKILGMPSLPLLLLLFGASSRCGTPLEDVALAPLLAAAGSARPSRREVDCRFSRGGRAAAGAGPSFAEPLPGDPAPALPRGLFMKENVLRRLVLASAPRPGSRATEDDAQLATKVPSRLVFLAASAAGSALSAPLFAPTPAPAAALGASPRGLGGGAFRPSEVDVRLRPRGVGAGGPRGGASLEDVPERAKGGREDGPDRLEMLDLGDSSARREELPEGELPLLLPGPRGDSGLASRDGAPTPLVGREPGREPPPGREAGRGPALSLEAEGVGLGRLLALSVVEDLTRPPLAAPPAVDAGLLARDNEDVGAGEGSGRAPRLTRAAEVALRAPRPGLPLGIRLPPVPPAGPAGPAAPGAPGAAPAPSALLLAGLFGALSFGTTFGDLAGLLGAPSFGATFGDLAGSGEGECGGEGGLGRGARLVLL